MLIHQIGGCQQKIENCQIQLNTLAQLTSSHGKKTWDGQKSGRIICRLKPQFPLHHVLRNVRGMGSDTHRASRHCSPANPQGLLWDVFALDSPTLRYVWKSISSAHRPRSCPCVVPIWQFSKVPMASWGIYRCGVGIVRSTSATVNSNSVKKMNVAFSEKELFSILAMPSHWIVALSQNLKTSICRKIGYSAFHRSKGIDKILHHPSLFCQDLDQKIGFFSPFNPSMGGVGRDYTVIYHVQFTVFCVWLEILAACVFQSLCGNERMQLSFNYSGSFLSD